MAWNVTPAVQIIFWFTDDDNATVRGYINLPSAYLSSAVGVAKSLGELLRPLTSCAIPRIHIVYTATNDEPTRGGTLNQRGVFIFATDEAVPQKYVLHIPAIKPSKLVRQGDYSGVAINTSDNDIRALVTALITSGVAAPWSPNQPETREWTGAPLERLITAYMGYEKDLWR